MFNKSQLYIGLSLFLFMGVARLPAQPPGGGFGRAEQKIAAKFDKNEDGILNSEERKAAREFLKENAGDRRGGPRRGNGRGREPAKPGPQVNPGDVKIYPKADLYDTSVLRTIFLEFEDEDWEAQLAEFKYSDVHVPVTLTVDGKKYTNVGARFRGMSSFGMVSAGHKRSFNLSIDHGHKKQRVHGYKTLNLLNSAGDPTFMSSILYSQIARKHIPAPKANFVKVVINGESWGIYVNAQQFNKDFLAENYPSKKGNRWKVPGSPRATGGLDFKGEKISEYKRHYEIKSKDNEEAWKDLVELCRVIDKTPVDKLEAALKPMLNVDGLLWFLAIDLTLLNSDGYWIRSSDYSIYQDKKKVFHILPHDMNEAFHPGRGPGGRGGFRGAPRPGEILPSFMQDMLRLSPEQRKKLAELQKQTTERMNKILTPNQREQLQRPPGGFPGGRPGGFPGGPPGGFPGGPPGGFPGGPPGGPPPGGTQAGGSGLEVDPLIGMNDARKPLRSKILAVPSLRKRYLQCVHTLAKDSLDWKNLGPVVAQLRALISDEIKADTKKLTSHAEFLTLTGDKVAEPAGRSRGMNLRKFAEGRRKFLLSHEAVKKAIK